MKGAHQSNKSGASESSVDPKAEDASGSSNNASSEVFNPRVIALLNQKGGVGKTTSTANIGAAFALAGLRTLVVDLDPQSNLSLHFGHEPAPDQPTVRDLFMNPDIAASELIRQARANLWFMKRSRTVGWSGAGS